MISMLTVAALMFLNRIETWMIRDLQVSEAQIREVTDKWHIIGLRQEMTTVQYRTQKMLHDADVLLGRVPPRPAPDAKRHIGQD